MPAPGHTVLLLRGGLRSDGLESQAQAAEGLASKVAFLCGGDVAFVRVAQFGEAVVIPTNLFRIGSGTHSQTCTSFFKVHDICGAGQAVARAAGDMLARGGTKLLRGTSRFGALCR